MSPLNCHRSPFSAKRGKAPPTRGRILDQAIARQSGTLDALAPGMSVHDDLTDTLDVFGSYYRGTATPASREFLRGGVTLEHGDGHELSLRQNGENVKAALTGF